MTRSSGRAVALVGGTVQDYTQTAIAQDWVRWEFAVREGIEVVGPGSLLQVRGGGDGNQKSEGQELDRTA